jgi:protein-disulfide isomerase
MMILEKLKKWWNDCPHERAKNIFAGGNRLVNKKTGDAAVVVFSDLSCSYALIQYADGDRRTIDWMTPAGTPRADAIDCWEIAVDAK